MTETFRSNAKMIQPSSSSEYEESSQSRADYSNSSQSGRGSSNVNPSNTGGTRPQFLTLDGKPNAVPRQMAVTSRDNGFPTKNKLLVPSDALNKKAESAGSWSS